MLQLFQVEELTRRLGSDRVKSVFEGDAVKQFAKSCKKFMDKNPEIESDIIDEVGDGHRIDAVNTIIQNDFKFLNRFLEDRYHSLDAVSDRNFFKVIVESVRNKPELHQYSFEEIIRDLADFYEEELYFN